MTESIRERLYENSSILLNPPEKTKYLKQWLGQFTRNYTQTTKRGLLTTNKG